MYGVFCLRWHPGSLSTVIQCDLLMDRWKNRTFQLRGLGKKKGSLNSMSIGTHREKKSLEMLKP